MSDGGESHISGAVVWIYDFSLTKEPFPDYWPRVNQHLLLCGAAVWSGIHGAK